MEKNTVKSLLSTIKGRWWLIDEKNIISYKIIKGFTETCCHLPKPVRKKVFSVLDNLIIVFSRISLIINQISLTSYLISGKEKHSKVKVNILFLSNEYPSPYLLDLIFFEKPKIEKKFKTHIWNYKKKINHNTHNINAIFIKGDRFYSRFFEKQGFTSIPEWITMTLDISEPLDNIYQKFSKGAKEDIRKIKKYGYTYEISQDTDKLKMFYNKMYLPYISWKYGKTAEFSNFYTLKHLFEQGSKLLLIKHDDEYLFGGVFSVKKDKITATYAGVMEGKFDCIQEGAIAASYHYLIQHSKESGANIIDFGNSRSFINDGVFKYKRKWGTKIEKTTNDHPEIFSYKILNGSKGIKSFQANNPYISLEKNQLITDDCEN